MIVVFWSPKAGVSGVTANMLLMAHMIADKGIGRCLILKTDYSDANPESYIQSNVVEDEAVMFEDRGIDSLLMNLKSKPLTEELLRDCTTELIEDRLDILRSTRNNRGYFTGENVNLLTKLPNLATQHYEAVFVDATAGNGPISGALLKIADLVVVNLRQSPEMIEEAINNTRILDKSFFLFGQFSSESKYSMHNIRRRYRKLNKSNSAMIPFSGGICDAVSDGRLYEYLAVLENADKGTPEQETFAAIRNSSELLHKMLNDKQAGGVR